MSTRKQRIRELGDSMRGNEMTIAVNEMHDNTTEGMEKFNEYYNETVEYAREQAANRGVSHKGYEQYVHTIVLGKVKGYIRMKNESISGEDPDNMQPVTNKNLPYDDVTITELEVIKVGSWGKKRVIRVKDINTQDIYNMVIPMNESWKNAIISSGSKFTVRYERVVGTTGNVSGRFYMV